MNIVLILVGIFSIFFVISTYIEYK